MKKFIIALPLLGFVAFPLGAAEISKDEFQILHRRLDAIQRELDLVRKRVVELEQKPAATPVVEEGNYAWQWYTEEGYWWRWLTPDEAKQWGCTAICIPSVKNEKPVGIPFRAAAGGC